MIFSPLRNLLPYISPTLLLNRPWTANPNSSFQISRPLCHCVIFSCGAKKDAFDSMGQAPPGGMNMANKRVMVNTALCQSRVFLLQMTRPDRLFFDERTCDVSSVSAWTKKPPGTETETRTCCKGLLRFTLI